MQLFIIGGYYTAVKKKPKITQPPGGPQKKIKQANKKPNPKKQKKQKNTNKKLLCFNVKK